MLPVAELQRPRIDVVYTLGGIYRDGFPDEVLLLDKATQLVAAAEGGDNAIARNTTQIAAALRRAWRRMASIGPFGISIFGWWRRRGHGSTESGMRLLSLAAPEPTFD